MSEKTGKDWWGLVTRQNLTQGPINRGWFKTEGGYASGVDTKHPGLGPGSVARANLAPDDKTRIKRLSESSGIPVNRFGKIKGDIVYWDDGVKKFIPVVPHIGRGKNIADKIYRANEAMLGASTKAASAIVGGVAGAIAGPTGTSLAVSGAAAGLTSVGLQALDKLIANEPMGDFKWAPVLGDIALNALGQGVGVGLVKLFNRNPLAVQAYDRLRALNPRLTRDAVEIQKIAKEQYGIDLTTAQSTEMRSLLAAERQAGRWPETMDKVYDARNKQWGEQVPDAIRGEIAKVTPARGEEASKAFRAGADTIVKEAEKKAADDAKGHYKAAFSANRDVASPQLNRLLKTKSGKAALHEAIDIMDDKMALAGTPDAELTEAMREAAALGRSEFVPGGVSKGLKLQTWDFIKQGLWRLEKAAEKDTGQSTSKSKAIGKIRRKMVKELDRLDVTAMTGPKSRKTAGGEYARARGFFQSGMEAKDAILHGGVEMLRKTKSDTVKLVNKIFNEGNVTPEEVGRMRAKFYAGGQGDAWEAGVGRWLEGALGAATKEFKQGIGNVPGTFFARVWGTNEQKSITKAALGASRMEGFEVFLKVLDKARKSFPEGSPTATDFGSMAPDAISRATRVVGKGLSGSTYLNLGDKISAGVTNIRQPAARIRLADALFSPDGLKQLKKLRLLSPTNARALTIVSDIMVKAGVHETREALESEASGAPLDPKIKAEWEKFQRSSRPATE